jgi:hypothetical protein
VPGENGGGGEKEECLENHKKVTWPTLHDRYKSGDKINENVMSWSCGRCGGEWKFIQCFDRKPEVKRPIG